MFRLHHIHRAINCATGASISLNNLVNLLLTNETISLAFEEGRLVIVSNGNVVFFTTTPKYSAEVHEFLQKQKLVRSLRKEVKDIEKQLKAYSTPELPNGDKLPSFLSEERQHTVIEAMKQPVVDLSLLKAGDKVVFRDNTEHTVKTVVCNQNNTYKSSIPYLINFMSKSKSKGSFGKNGNYLPSGCSHPYDIVKVIPR